MSYLDKKGEDSGIGPFVKTILGLIIAVPIVLVLVSLMGKFFTAFVFTDSLDPASKTSFEQLSEGVAHLASTDETSDLVPTDIDSDFLIVTFNPYEGSVQTCGGTVINRPSQCKNACICVCEANDKPTTCGQRNARCKSYGTITFEPVCLMGDGERRSYALEQENEQIKIRKA